MGLPHQPSSKHFVCNTTKIEILTTSDICDLHRVKTRNQLIEKAARE